MSTLYQQNANNNVSLCRYCELSVELIPLSKGKSSYCPRCGALLHHHSSYSLSSNIALAISGLLLLIPSHIYPFITIRLLGVTIPATLASGTFTLMQEGFALLAGLVFFCSSVAPFLLYCFIILTHISLRLRWFTTFQHSLTVLNFIKKWVMLDVFLVSIAISCFKLRDYADIQLGWGLSSVILLQLITLILISKINSQLYWELWEKEITYQFSLPKTCLCNHCYLFQPDASNCVRCQHRLLRSRKKSTQKIWAYLLTAIVMLFPANILPISILMENV